MTSKWFLVVYSRTSALTRVQLLLPCSEGCALTREDQATVFQTPLKQGTKAFGAQGILSSGAATDVVVFILWKGVSKDISSIAD